MKAATDALYILLLEERLGERYAAGLAMVVKYRRHAGFVAMILLQAAERGVLDDVLAELGTYRPEDTAPTSRLRRLVRVVIGTPTERFLDRLFMSVQEPPAGISPL